MKQIHKEKNLKATGRLWVGRQKGRQIRQGKPRANAPRQDGKSKVGPRWDPGVKLEQQEQCSKQGHESTNGRGWVLQKRTGSEVGIPNQGMHSTDQIKIKRRAKSKGRIRQESKLQKKKKSKANILRRTKK